MKTNQIEFLETCIRNSILIFGEYTLKSGRKSPYFFNAGLFDNGSLLGMISACYADLLAEKLSGRYMLYGPAYKGIPLVCATALQLFNRHGINVNYAFNRKEKKDHGEGGNLVGANLAGNVVIVDDVITAGTSIHESMKIINDSGAAPYAVLIALDRQETMNEGRMSSLQKIEDQYGIPVLSLIKLDDLIEYIENSAEFQQFGKAVRTYRQNYGINFSTDLS